MLGVVRSYVPPAIERHRFIMPDVFRQKQLQFTVKTA
jgi:hypothetical protein